MDSNWCRLCLNNSFSYSNIYHGDSADGNPIYKDFNLVYGLQICEKDGLPEYVCRGCVSFLKEYNKRKRNAIRAEYQLKYMKRKMDIASGAVGVAEKGQEEIATKMEVKEKDIESEKNTPLAEDLIDGESSKGNEGIGVGVREGGEECVAEEESVSAEGNEIRLDVSSERGKVTCYHCGERKETKEEISEHILKVHGYGREDKACKRGQSKQQRIRKRHVCNVCSKEFSYKSSLVMHMTVHSGEMPFTCPVCKKAFSRRGNLDNHMITHQSAKPLKCPKCEYRCKRKDNLKCHMVVHQEEKKFKCPKCDYRCKRNHALNVHLLVHQDLKPFKCSVCDYRSKRKRDLLEHMYNHV